MSNQLHKINICENGGGVKGNFLDSKTGIMNLSGHVRKVQGQGHNK